MESMLDMFVFFQPIYKKAALHKDERVVITFLGTRLLCKSLSCVW